MKRQSLFACLLIAWSLLGSLPASEAQGKVNINTGSLEELDTLPGIGPAIAARIIEFRTKNGPFRRAEDLMNVRGIGEKKFLKLKGRIVLAGVETVKRNPGSSAKRAASASPARK